MGEQRKAITTTTNPKPPQANKAIIERTLSKMDDDDWENATIEQLVIQELPPVVEEPELPVVEEEKVYQDLDTTPDQMYPIVFIRQKIEKNQKILATETNYRKRNGSGRRTVHEIDLRRDTSIREEVAIQRVLDGLAIIVGKDIDWTDTTTYRKKHTIEELMDYKNWRIVKQQYKSKYDAQRMVYLIN